MRKLMWFSCGIASACAAKLAVTEYTETEVLYCDTLKYEHQDNTRFLKDVEKWIGKEIKILRSKKYSDIYDVFDKTGWLVGHGMARCTTELKRVPRFEYQKPDDIHIFGYTVEEKKRAERFEEQNVEKVQWILIEHGMTKQDCVDMVQSAGVEVPAMYKLGYKNNNCIGCVKGGMGYWNKIRKDFPEMFEKMAQQERKMGVSCVRGTFLDELKEGRGTYESEVSLECGVLCQTELPGLI